MCMIHTIHKLCLKHVCIQLINTNGMHYTKNRKKIEKLYFFFKYKLYLLTFVKLIKILSCYHHPIVKNYV